MVDSTNGMQQDNKKTHCLHSKHFPASHALKHHLFFCLVAFMSEKKKKRMLEKISIKRLLICLNSALSQSCCVKAIHLMV